MYNSSEPCLDLNWNTKLNGGLHASICSMWRLFSQGSTYAPSFDHGVGDPVEDDVFVSSE